MDTLDDKPVLEPAVVGQVDELPVPDEIPPSQEALEKLILDANILYSQAHYQEAVDIYSAATEMQSKINGEMAVENADLLFRYGRCLYQVAILKSDILGGKMSSLDADKKVPNPTEVGIQGSRENIAALSTSSVKASPPKDGASVDIDKSRFQILDNTNLNDVSENDSNASNDDDGDGDDDDGASAVAEEDDFANAYEILDLARVLLRRRLDALEAQCTLDKIDDTNAKGAESPIKHTQKLLADTLDYQAEISLENERFHDAMQDCKAALELKEKIYPRESNLLAEAYFKLAIALEFASVNSIREAQRNSQTQGDRTETDAEAKVEKTPQVDEELRKLALEQMEKAINSCQLRVELEQKELDSIDEKEESRKEERETRRKSIEDVKEMIKELKQRAQDLKAPFQLTERVSGNGDSIKSNVTLQGLLGEIFGTDSPEKKIRLDEVMRNANNISDLIKSKKRSAPDSSTELPIHEQKSPVPADCKESAKRTSDDKNGHFDNVETTQPTSPSSRHVSKKQKQDNEANGVESC